MAEKPVVWYSRAQKSRMEILKYWVERNGTSTYSERLIAMFDKVVSEIAREPSRGNATNFGNVRRRMVKTYAVYYEELEKSIEILLVWDQRRNPSQLNEILGAFRK